MTSEILSPLRRQTDHYWTATWGLAPRFCRRGVSLALAERVTEDFLEREWSRQAKRTPVTAFRAEGKVGVTAVAFLPACLLPYASEAPRS